MSYCLDEADKLALVGSQCAVAGRHGPAKEGDQMALLDKDRVEADGRRITFVDERLGEVGYDEDGGCCDGGFECGEC